MPDTVFILSAAEASAILLPKTTGGHQDFQAMLWRQLHPPGDFTGRVVLSDAQLGKLVRYMLDYGDGNYQGRLRKAFLPQLVALLQNPRPRAAERKLRRG